MGTKQAATAQSRGHLTPNKQSTKRMRVTRPSARRTRKPVTRVTCQNDGHRPSTPFCMQSESYRKLSESEARNRRESSNHVEASCAQRPSCLLCPISGRAWPSDLAETQHHNVGRHASSISGRCGVAMYLPQISLQSREDRSLTC